MTEQKFNVGDLVNWDPQYWVTAYKFGFNPLKDYKVELVRMNTITVCNDNGVYHTFLKERFILASRSTEEEEEDGTYILIVKRSNGKYAPASNPRTYSSKAQAKAVARSMSEKYPGQPFVVFKAVAMAEAKPKTTYETTYSEL